MRCFFIAIFFLFEVHAEIVVNVIDLPSLMGSNCHQQYLSVADQKLSDYQSGKTDLRDKRTFNLYNAAIKGSGHHTYDAIVKEVRYYFDIASHDQIMSWLRYGFTSGDFCPQMPFINTYYNWAKAYKYIIKGMYRDGDYPPKK